jgi:pimeloyl-ACP methyl ester carboxylesterase
MEGFLTRPPDPSLPSIEVQPTVHDGLAVYAAGSGRPVLLMPSPHGFTAGPAAHSALAGALLRLHRQLVTFDPPGAYASCRPARLDMPEMIAAAQETLQVAGPHVPIDLVGHSMSALCALAFALAQPAAVRRLVLVGSLSGGPILQRAKAMPRNWKITDADFWRFCLAGLPLSRGRGNLAAHKRLLRLMWKASYVDQRFVPTLPSAAADDRQPAPVRDAWPRYATRLDYSARLSEVRVPTLIVVGRFDPQTPVLCSQQLAAGIPCARLVVFDRSGHYPFVEEQAVFGQVVREFLDATR